MVTSTGKGDKASDTWMFDVLCFFCMSKLYTGNHQGELVTVQIKHATIFEIVCDGVEEARKQATACLGTPGATNPPKKIGL